VLSWREDLATAALSAWDKGANVLVSNRLLDAQPADSLHWAEGEDRRISWRDIHSLFSTLESSESIGGTDGFEIISPSSNNRRMFEALIRDRPRSSHLP
jgi:hypothetical protein